MQKISIMNRKGISHIEIILSFVIFVGFLIFLIAIFKPFRLVSGGEVYLDILEREIKENSSVEVEFITIGLGEEVNTNNCFCFDYGFEDNVVVKDQDYNVIKANSNGQICADDKGSARKFFYIYSSEEFEEITFTPPADGCGILSEENYTLGLYRKFSMISNISLNRLYEKTKEDYEDVKLELGLPSSKDFSFGLRTIEAPYDIILEEVEKPAKGVKVLARSTPIQLVNKKGGFDYARLNIEVW